MHQFYRYYTGYSPLSQQFDILFVVFILFASRLVPFFYSPLDICITQRRSRVLTRTMVIITSHSFNNNVRRISNSVYTQTINFLLSTSGNNSLNYTVRLKALKVWKDHFLEITQIVLAWCEAPDPTLMLLFCQKTSRHCLTDWTGIKLKGINSNNELAQIRWLPCKRFIHWTFTCKDYGPYLLVFSPKTLCPFWWKVKVLNLLIFVNNYLLNLVAYIQALKYQSPCCGEIQSSFTSLPILGQNLFGYYTWKKLQNIA